jgi:uncharacterized protein YdeI (YjbR/CyaY-like superfamily)
MAIVKKHPKVDALIHRAGQWQAELTALRTLVLSCGLDEAVKWGQPCYTVDSGNVLIIHGIKEYCALLFFKGSLMKDPAKLLIQQTVNVQGARQIRFTALKEITQRKSVLKRYVLDAVAVERSGAKLDLKKTAEFDVPAELAARLKAQPAFKKAFEALTPGRQRGYLLFFGGAKQAATREARIDKHVKDILAGKGLHD